VGLASKPQEHKPVLRITTVDFGDCKRSLGIAIVLYSETGRRNLKIEPI